VRRRTHPQSPVQRAPNRWWAPFLLAFLAAIAFWTWQQSIIQPDEPPAPLAEHAKANLMALFSDDDYPAAAIRREEQGTVAFKLSINRRGGVDRCDIVSSSGSATLDHATCEIVTSRARFVPARDSRGDRIADEYSGRVRWVLPSD
jgi:protein TonB